MSEQSCPLIVTVRIKDRVTLDELDKTRLVKILYDASALRLMYRQGEAWIGITSVPKETDMLVTLAAPVVNTGPLNLESIKNAYIARADKEAWFGPPDSVLIEDDVLPNNADGWEKPVLYPLITHTNQPATPVDPFQWLAYNATKVKRNRKGNAYMDNDEQAHDPYKLWDPVQYETYACKKAEDPCSVSKANTVARQLEIHVDVVGLGLPPVDCTGYSQREDTGFENVRVLTGQLVGRLADTGTKDITVWIDCVRVIASITRIKGSKPTLLDLEKREFLLAELDTALSRVFSKEERDSVGLDPSSVQASYSRSQQELYRGEYVIGFETLIEHLEAIAPEVHKEWKNLWMNAALDDIYTKVRSPMVGAAILASRHTRGTNVYEETSPDRGVWYSYDAISKSWKRRTPDVEDFLQLSHMVQEKGRAISKEPTCNSDLLGLLHSSGEVFNAAVTRRKVLTEMKDMLRVVDFHSMVDKNYSILPVINGCIEVVDVGDKKTVVVRPHKKQDFTTKVVGVKYEDLGPDHPDVRFVMGEFAKIWPEQEVLEWMLYWTGSTLWRGNRDRCIVNMYGPGGNGKTGFLAALGVLDRFIGQIKASAFYSYEKNAATADTEFMALKGAAIAIVEEIEPGKTGRVTTAKNLSGGGWLPLRAIFQAEERVKSTAKLLFVGNHLLHWPEDMGMVDRTYIVECNSRFSDEAPADPEQQRAERHYPKDTEFSDKMSKLAPAILWIFVEYLKKYVALGGLPRCDKIAADSHRYWISQNIHREFLSLFYTDLDGSHVSTNDLLTHAGTYFHKHRNGREYSVPGFMKYLVATYGVYDAAVVPKRGYDEERGVIYGLAKKDM